MLKNEEYIETSTGLWEIIIGLEVHAQIVSKSKLFSSSSTKFGAAPNENVSFIDAALPGTLPVINSFCVDQAIKTGLGLNGTINLGSRFDRKNYFYADLPAGYQITQFQYPIITGGYIDAKKQNGTVRRLSINHIHLEQDAGKSIHDQSPNKTFIDLNRAGIALMEIVTEPDMRSAEDVSIFLKDLRTILRYLKTCDGNMEEGSMRADVNISVHRPNTEFGTRVEIKNVNSIKFISTAIEYETQRQIEIIESGGTIEQETRLFDNNTGKTILMRSKEDAQDYRYFPEPDIPPLFLKEERIEKIRKTIPELPDAKAKRFEKELNLSTYDASLISSEMENAIFYEEALTFDKSNNPEFPKILANWMVVELYAILNKNGCDIDKSKITAKNLAELVLLILDETISGKIAKDVILIMWDTGKSPSTIINENNLRQINSKNDIEKILTEVLDSNSDKVIEYKSGKEKLFGFFLGQAMKKTNGQANPKMLNDILKELLNK